jgi:hypothetical protein
MVGSSESTADRANSTDRADREARDHTVGSPVAEKLPVSMEHGRLFTRTHLNANGTLWRRDGARAGETAGCGAGAVGRRRRRAIASLVASSTLPEPAHRKRAWGADCWSQLPGYTS